MKNKQAFNDKKKYMRLHCNKYKIFGILQPQPNQGFFPNP